MAADRRSRPRTSAHEFALRRLRVLAMTDRGLSKAEIAGCEGVTVRRIRQIVAGALHEQRDGLADLRVMNAALLEPELQLTTRIIEEGRLEGIDRLLKVIDCLDRSAPKAGRPAGARNRRHLGRRCGSGAGESARVTPEPALTC